MGNKFGNGSALQVTAAEVLRSLVDAQGAKKSRKYSTVDRNTRWQGSGGMTLGQAAFGRGQKIPKKVLNRFAPSRHQSMEGGGNRCFGSETRAVCRWVEWCRGWHRRT